MLTFVRMKHVSQNSCTWSDYKSCSYKLSVDVDFNTKRLFLKLVNWENEYREISSSEKDFCEVRP